MATSFVLRSPQGRQFTVRRKFLLDKKSINFVEIIPKDGDKPELRSARRLPDSPFSLYCFPHLKDSFLLASEVCDLLKLRVGHSSHPTIKTVDDLRKFANDSSQATKQSKRYDEVSLKLFGQNHAPYVDGLRLAVVQRFRDAFDEIQMVHPDDLPSERKFLFGSDLHASEKLKSQMYAIALEGHAYAQYVCGLLAASDGPVTVVAAKLLVDAHSQGVPVALAALGERLCNDRFFLDALNCALLSLEGGFGGASTILDNLEKATFNLLLETPTGYIPFLPYLVHNELEEEVRLLAFKHRPKWVPMTHDEVIRKMMARHGSAEV